MKRANKAKKLAKKTPKSNKDKFGGLKRHKIDLDPVEVFALKVEYGEEGGSTGGYQAVPVGPVGPPI